MFFLSSRSTTNIFLNIYFHVTNIFFHADMLFSSVNLLGVLAKTNGKCLASAFLLFTLLLSILPSYWFAINLSDKQFFNANMRN